LPGVVYLPVKYRSMVSGFPNAGPRPNVTGMRKIYGKNAYLVMCGQYLYHVDRETYYRCK
jgi:hypothetical protein